jgi:hypothetical protein
MLLMKVVQPAIMEPKVLILWDYLRYYLQQGILLVELVQVLLLVLVDQIIKVVMLLGLDVVEVVADTGEVAVAMGYMEAVVVDRQDMDLLGLAVLVAKG